MYRAFSHKFKQSIFVTPTYVSANKCPEDGNLIAETYVGVTNILC